MLSRFARNALAFVSAFVLTACVGIAFAAPPYDVTVTFDPAPGAASYNLYVDDCAATGATGVPIVSGYVSGTVQTALLAVDGTFEICIRSVDSSAQELPNPGPVATVTVGPLGTIQNLSITVDCPNGPCNVTTVVN